MRSEADTRAPKHPDRARPGLFVGLLAFGLVAALGADHGGYFPTAWGWAALLAAAAGIIASLLCGARLRRLELASVLALGALAAWTLASVAWTGSVGASVLEAERVVLYLAVLTAALLIVRKRTAAALLIGVWAASAAVSAYALATRLFPERLTTVDPIAGYRLSAPVGYWNGLGVLTALGALLGLGLAARASTPLFRALAAASLPVCLPALYFTFSRGAWAGLSAGLLVLLLVDPRRLQLTTTLLAVAPATALAVWRASASQPLTHDGYSVAAAAAAGHRLALLVTGSAVLAAAATAAEVALERRVRLPNRTRTTLGLAAATLLLAGSAGLVARAGAPLQLVHRSKAAFAAPLPRVDGSLNQRLFSVSGGPRFILWSTALRDFRAHPALGSGAGTFESYWLLHRSIHSKVRDAHNLYAETLGELGAVGLALLVAALGLPLLGARAARRHPLGPLALAGYSIFLLHATFDWDWELPVVTLSALLCGAALLAAGRGPGAPRGRLGRSIPAALLLVLLPASVLGLLGNRASAASARAASRGDWRLAASGAHDAARFEPWSSEPSRLLGEARLAAGDDAAARVSFGRALAKDPDRWDLWLALARASRGRARTADLARARALNPLSPELDLFDVEIGAPSDAGNRSRKANDRAIQVVIR